MPGSPLVCRNLGVSGSWFSPRTLQLSDAEDSRAVAVVLLCTRLIMRNRSLHDRVQPVCMCVGACVCECAYACVRARLQSDRKSSCRVFLFFSRTRTRVLIAGCARESWQPWGTASPLHCDGRTQRTKSNTIYLCQGSFTGE